MARRKSYNYIGKIIKTGQPLMLVDEKGENFLYFDKLKMLLPIRQSMEKYDVKDFIQYLSGALVTELNGISLNLTLIKAQHACEVFSWLNKIPEMVKWNIQSSLWFVDNKSHYMGQLSEQNIVYNGKFKKIDKLAFGKANILWVIYLTGRHVLEDGKVKLNELEQYGLRVSDKQMDFMDYNGAYEEDNGAYEEDNGAYEEEIVDYEIDISDKEMMNPEIDAIGTEEKMTKKASKRGTDMEDNYIQKLLDCDKRRCGIASYAANTLAKNIQTLKGEARKWKLLDGVLLEERLIIGSAKGHLQKLGIVDGNYCIKKIEEDEEYKKAWSYGDGIDYAYEKLVEYNETERFPILKKKIQRNNEGLKGIANELRDRYKEGGVGIDYSPMLKGIAELLADAKKTVCKELEELRHEIRNKYREDPVLSRRLQEEIYKLFEDEEKYAINDDDIHNAELKIDDASGSVNVEKLEEDIREAKFNQIYKDFSSSAFAVAQKDHAVHYDRIMDSFENALKVNKKSANYDEIHSAIGGFVQKYKKNIEDDFIYQSVIERFVRDVVEVLIRRPYSSEARLNKFIDEAEVFSGLVMFYNTGDADTGFKRQFLSVAPKNQPLLLALVFHDYKSSDEASKSVMDYMGSISKSLCDNSEVIQLGFSIVKQDPIGGLDAVRKTVTKNEVKSCKTDDDYLREVIPKLRKLKVHLREEGETATVNSTKKYDFDFSNREVFQRQYKQFFGNTAVRSYENIKEFFEVDLEILEKFLIHASIPAIRLEKPFVAREVQSINRLLDKRKCKIRNNPA